MLFTSEILPELGKGYDRLNAESFLNSSNNESPVLLFVWLQRAVKRFRPKRGEKGGPR
jgi:hypothetical protein